MQWKLKYGQAFSTPCPQMRHHCILGAMCLGVGIGGQRIKVRPPKATHDMLPITSPERWARNFSPSTTACLATACWKECSMVVHKMWMSASIRSYGPDAPKQFLLVRTGSRQQRAWPSPLLMRVPQLCLMWWPTYGWRAHSLQWTQSSRQTCSECPRQMPFSPQLWSANENWWAQPRKWRGTSKNCQRDLHMVLEWTFTIESWWSCSVFCVNSWVWNVLYYYY